MSIIVEIGNVTIRQFERAICKPLLAIEQYLWLHNIKAGAITPMMMPLNDMTQCRAHIGEVARGFTLAPENQERYWQ